MPRQTLSHLFQVVFSNFLQGRIDSWLFLTENGDDDQNIDWYAADDLLIAADFFRFCHLTTEFIDDREPLLSVNVPDDFDFSNISNFLAILQSVGFEVRESTRELLIDDGRNPALSRQNLLALIEPVVRVDGRHEMGRGTAAATADFKAPAAPTHDAVRAAEVPEDPLEYFLCPISLGKFEIGQTINVLPNGSLIEGVAMRQNITRTNEHGWLLPATNPVTNERIDPNIHLYVYQALMDYINNHSNVNLLSLIQDPITHEIMKTPRMWIYYNATEHGDGTVRVAICDETTSGHGVLAPEFKRAFFNNPSLSNALIRNVAFDALGNFIRHPVIQAANQDRIELARIQSAYFRHRKGFFPPVDLGSVYQSHAAKIRNARTTEEVKALLLAADKPGEQNASTRTVDELQLRPLSRQEQNRACYYSIR